MYPRYTFTYAHDKPEEQAYKIVSHPKYGVPVQVLMRNPVRPSLGSTCGSVNGSIRERDSVNLEQLDVAWSV